MKKFIRKIVYGVKSDQKTYLTYLRSHGAQIGEDVNLFDIDKISIDHLNLHLLSIGDHVSIVASTILMHDYSWSVIKGITGEILGNQRPVHIGNNVFIGKNSIILGGTTIGNNVIIGAGSIVSGVCEDNTVYAGNPARKIMSIDDYIAKRRRLQFKEAKIYVQRYISAYGKEPTIDKLHEYFFLFTKQSDNLHPALKNKIKLCGNEGLSIQYIDEHAPMFESFDVFINACKDKSINRKG